MIVFYPTARPAPQVDRADHNSIDRRGGGNDDTSAGGNGESKYIVDRGDDRRDDRRGVRVDVEKITNIFYDRTCADCNKPFTSAARWARFCSAACRQRDYRRRRDSGEMIKRKPKNNEV